MTRRMGRSGSQGKQAFRRGPVGHPVSPGALGGRAHRPGSVEVAGTSRRVGKGLLVPWAPPYVVSVEKSGQCPKADGLPQDEVLAGTEMPLWTQPPSL